MGKVVKRFADWLFSKTDRGAEIEAERDRCVAMLVRVREQYRKFGLLSPLVQVEINELIDTFRGSLGNAAGDIFKKSFDIPIEEIDVVPRLDYEALRVSHQKLMLLLAKYQTEGNEKDNPPEATASV